MKKILFLGKRALALAGALFFAGALAHAQTQTNVTATIVDPLGIPYANGTYSIQLIPAGTNPTVNGNSIGGAFNGRLDANGSFNVSLWPNAVIVPGGTQWQFTICSNSGGIQPPLGTGGQCTPPTAVTIGGASQNLSSTLSAVAPRLTTITIGGGSVTSVSCGNLANIFTCTVLTPTTTPALVFTPLSAGPTLDCSTFPGAPDAGLQINNCLAALPGGTGIADATNFGPTATITTPVVNSIFAVVTSCGTFFTDIGHITLSGFGSSWWACPSSITQFDKAANGPQFTITGTNNVVSNVYLSGEAPTFTGDGFFLNGSTDTTLQNVNINSENDSEVHTTGIGSGSAVNNSFLNDSHLHAVFIDGSSILALNNDQITDSGNGTGNTIETTAAPNVGIYAEGINVTTRSAHIGFNNQQIGGVTSTIHNSVFLDTGGMPAMQLSSTDIVTGNKGIFGGGTGQPAIIGPLADPGGAATISFNQNIENAAGSDAVRIGGETHFEGNYIFVTLTGMAGKCGINLFGESSGATVKDNSITLSAGESGANFGICITPQAAQPASINRIRDNFVVLATTSDFIFKFNNAAAVGSSSGSQITGNFASGASGGVISRNDPPANSNYYSNNRGAGPPFDAGGSASDILAYDSDTITFANLPAIVGNGSHFFCSDCTQGIAAAGGAGGTITRLAGAWLTQASDQAPTVSSGFGTGAAVAAGGIPQAFRLNVGTTNTGTGIISLPVAKTGWNCSAVDVTTTSAAVAQTKQIATGSDTSHAAVQNYTDLGATGPWTDSDVLAGTCTPF